ncbi:hypothetical protein BC939DRAFT_475893 [Gamsiella multidivaricata]|uniref:uncharacterized protein n=1 Tax=Gamsiella multidivaricata TaxID=101098 RepID=UPI00221FD844|nr:uncharacterized protein BC939DRAFT_475893 [Gamsiella multidivaricata]KAI7826202.1 hypothetical protein BC939DRAFT_475893 [Gamsiella multidivaricata]
MSLRIPRSDNDSDSNIFGNHTTYNDNHTDSDSDDVGSDVNLLDHDIDILPEELDEQIRFERDQRDNLAEQAVIPEREEHGLGDNGLGLTERDRETCYAGCRLLPPKKK